MNTKSIINKEPTDDTSDDTVDTVDGDFRFLFNGIKLNSFKNDAFPGYVYSSVLDTLKNPKQVFLKGGEGVMAEIELFKNDDGVDLLEEIRSKEWLINEANLSIYIDKKCFPHLEELSNLQDYIFMILKIKRQ
jgi:hypothetical protein